MRIHMIANAHIDPVWLWPWQAGVDEAIATSASMADRCDEYPDFIFTRGEAWLYRQVEQLHPALFERIRQLVARGQWHITGGQFLQPDLNLPTAEGLHRQIRHGQRYFQGHFGVSPKIGYNVDSFGHTASLPDILAGHGYHSYVFRRPEQHQTAIPANTFIWRGVDGAEVVAFRIEPAYVANFADLTGQLEIAIESADPALGHTMCFYGVGNHGGGPSKAMIDWIIAHKHSFAGHELVFSTPEAYFAGIADKHHLLPTVSHELQHAFPGCYSVMHDIKQRQRHTEYLLAQAESAANAFSADDRERQSYFDKLDGAWEHAMFTEFHDIITGTSIPSAWESVRSMQGTARLAAEEVILHATRRWSYRTLPKVNEHQVVAINTAATPFAGYIEAEPYLDFDVWGERWVSDEHGTAIPHQVIQPESNQLIPRILLHTDVPAGTSRQLQVHNEPRAASPPADGLLMASPTSLSNGLVEVSLRPGGIGGISLDGKNLLGNGGMGLHLRKDTTDTWTFHTDQWSEAIEETLTTGSWVVEETGPLRVRARLDARIGTSRLQWTVSLCRDQPVVEIELAVNWDERFRLLQLPISLAAAPATHTDGIADAAITRQAEAAEWPFLDFVRLDGDARMALTTKDLYSHSVNGSTWQLTFLRSPKMAWGGGDPEPYTGRDHIADQGVHRFALTLHLGDAASETAIAAAVSRLRHPPVVFDRYEGMNRPNWGPVPPRGLWGPAMQRNLEAGRVEGEKPAPGGGLFKRPGYDYAG
jgi:alpha-mannosidase